MIDLCYQSLRPTITPPRHPFEINNFCKSTLVAPSMGAWRSYNASLVNDGCGDWMRYYVVVVGFGIAIYFRFEKRGWFAVSKSEKGRVVMAVSPPLAWKGVVVVAISSLSLSSPVWWLHVLWSLAWKEDLLRCCRGCCHCSWFPLMLSLWWLRWCHRRWLFLLVQGKMGIEDKVGKEGKGDKIRKKKKRKIKNNLGLWLKILYIQWL